MHLPVYQDSQGRILKMGRDSQPIPFVESDSEKSGNAEHGDADLKRKSFNSRKAQF